MMNPMLPGPGIVGYGSVMGPPHLQSPHHSAHGHAVSMHSHVPDWRARGMAAPGVPVPSEGRQILPLQPSNTTGTFAAITDRINYTARPQKAFLAERLVVNFAKVGASGLGSLILCDGTFTIGTDPQLVEIAPFCIEPFTGAGLDLNLLLTQAEPGIIIELRTQLQGPVFVPGTDSVTLSMFILGRQIG